MGFCSAVTLAFATIFSLVAAALLAIAFSTDNWITITVTRDKLKVRKYLGDTKIFGIRSRIWASYDGNHVVMGF